MNLLQEVTKRGVAHAGTHGGGLLRHSRPAAAAAQSVWVRAPRGGCQTSPSTIVCYAGDPRHQGASVRRLATKNPRPRSSSSPSSSPSSSSTSSSSMTSTAEQPTSRKARMLASLFDPANLIAEGEGGSPSVPLATADFVRSITDEERKAAHAFFTHDTAFLTSATSDLRHLPPADQPEFAFVGRSNVGKSTLLNAIMGHPGLARTSNTPGRTQLINYFGAGNRVRLVDLPGYGYARAPVKVVKEWHKFVNDFLTSRKAIRGVCLLLDARRGVTDKDREMVQMLNSHATPYQLILTKADKLSRREIFAVMQETREATKNEPYCSSIIYITSKEGLGIDELRVGLMRAALK